MAGKRLTEREREAIADDLRATLGTPEGSIAKIAKRHGRSTGTIRSVRDKAGIDQPAVTRAATKNAAILHAEQCAQLRQELSFGALLDAKAAREDMNRPVYVYNFGGKDNVFADAIATRPSPSDRQKLSTIFGTMVDKHGVLERFESDNAHRAHMDAYLEHLFGAKDAT